MRLPGFVPRAEVVTLAQNYRSTQALLDNWDNVAGVQVIARSRIVKMGVAVANVALHGRVQSFDMPKIFENAIVAACRA